MLFREIILVNSETPNKYTPSTQMEDVVSMITTMPHRANKC